MRAKGQTSVHLLLAGIVTMFGVMLILITIALSWELWMVPVILIGNTLIWCLHIGRIGSETFYENLCSGLLMVGFFFFGVHEITLFDIPSVACMLILIFSMFDKKRLLYMTAALYVLELVYQLFILHTITWAMGMQHITRLCMGATVVAGAMAIAVYRINRRLEARKQYDKTLMELETAGRQNAEFLSNVSHELRTPINMVLGISEVILEKNISPEIRADMNSIQMAGKRLSNQINNMLDYTEIVEGTLTPAKEPYMINSLLNDIITMTAMQSSKHQLEMVFDLDPKIPSVLIGDMEKISHVLKILLENSIKFTEEGGLNVCVQYRKESYGINLIIDICDTGIGMTSSQITQIFDDFYQADTGSSRFAGGLGLGLPIARGLLHAMGGFIHFDSKEQEGLQAQITIPQGVANDTPAMIISRPDKLCIACYFRPEKYANDEVRRYYDNMILHMIKGLYLEGYQAHNFEGLQKLLNTHPVTHVFIAQAEYEENISYYEELTGRYQVVVIAERDFIPNRSSRLLVIHKPFFALSVVNLLNGEVSANGFEEAQAAGRKPFSCEGVRVLAVDDEEMNLVVAKGVLGSYGIQVDTCLSGREAVERCVANSYDIVFLDHMMPGFDGVETLKQIREINNGAFKDLPIIALTANTISGAREMFRNEGFTEFIPKPIERAVLERVLRKVLSKNQVQYDEVPSLPTTPSDAPTDRKKRKRKRKKNTQPAGTAVTERTASDPSGQTGRVPDGFLSGHKTRSEEEASEDFSEDKLSEDETSENFSVDKLNEDEVSKNFPEDEPDKDETSESFTEDENGSDRSSGDFTEDQEEDGSSEDFTEDDDEDNDGSSEDFTEDDDEEEDGSSEDFMEDDEDDDGSSEDFMEDDDGDDESSEDFADDEDDHGFSEDFTEEEDGGNAAAKTSYDFPDEGSEYQDGTNLSDPSSQPYSALTRIGINVQLGLDYCGGEEDFYREMLWMFLSQAPEKKAELVYLYDTANWTDYTVKVHALKSTSLTIGAERLAGQARLLEQAGKKENIEYIRHSHSRLMHLYDEICDTIAGL